MKNKDGHINQNSHKIQEAGFGYYLENLKDLPSGKKKKGLVVEVKGVFPFTLSESNGIGVVKKIYVLKSSSNKIQDKREPTLQATSKFGLCYTPCILALIYG